VRRGWVGGGWGEGDKQESSGQGLPWYILSRSGDVDGGVKGGRVAGGVPPDAG
jgi:hypothetical protein